VLGHWAANAQLCRRHKHQLAIAAELRRRRVCRRAFAHWRTAVLRTRVLRSLLREHHLGLLQRALVSFKAHALQRRCAECARRGWTRRSLVLTGCSPGGCVPAPMTLSMTLGV
jgi:hypothetical protein